MKKQLVLIGGGHAHMVTLARLETFVEQGVDVTVIQPSEYHYYSGMGPGMLGGTYKADDIRFATRQLVEAKGAEFILGKAARIDPDKQVVYLEDSEVELPYDVLSCNAGSYVPDTLFSDRGEHVFTSKPIEELQRAQAAILSLAAEKEIKIAVIGSGPSAIEIAGNIHQLCREKSTIPPKTQLFSGRTFMAGRPEKVKKLTRDILQNKGVEILECGRVEKVSGRVITMESGESFDADLIFPAVGVKPSKIFALSGLAMGPDGGLLVNDYLQSVDYGNIFGGGDCIYFQSQPLDKVGVYAVRQNPVLYNNLLSQLSGKQLKTFDPGGKYLLIYNLGDGEGVLSKWFITFGGKLAFRLKDYIDRKFIKAFQ